MDVVRGQSAWDKISEQTCFFSSYERPVCKKSESAVFEPVMMQLHAT